MKKSFSILGVLIMLFMIPACTAGQQVVEVTRPVLQTVVVTQLATQIITEYVTTTPIPTHTPIPISPTDTLEPTPVVSLSSPDGRIVVIQYYTLLSYHLYDQAYQLFSASWKAQYPEDKFLFAAANFYRFVKVLEVTPAKEEMQRDGANWQAVSDNVYYVEIYAEGENGMSGPFVNGKQTLYVLVTQENGDWKIDAWGNSANLQSNP